MARGGAVTDAEVEALRRGAWEIDCPRIAMKRRGGAGAPASLSGAGFIRQTSDRQLFFKLYPARSKNMAEPDLGAMFVEAGDAVPDEAYYDLVATDTYGRRW